MIKILDNTQVLQHYLQDFLAKYWQKPSNPKCPRETPFLVFFSFSVLTNLLIKSNKPKPGPPLQDIKMNWLKAFPFKYAKKCLWRYHWVPWGWYAHLSHSWQRQSLHNSTNVSAIAPALDRFCRASWSDWCPGRDRGIKWFGTRNEFRRDFGREVCRVSFHDWHIHVLRDSDSIILYFGAWCWARNRLRCSRNARYSGFCGCDRSIAWWHVNGFLSPGPKKEAILCSESGYRPVSHRVVTVSVHLNGFTVFQVQVAK
jgi:hypothetical protein